MPKVRVVELDPTPLRSARVSAEIPPGAYAGLTTVPGGAPELLGIRGDMTDVAIGNRIWRLPAGRYAVEGAVEVTLGTDAGSRAISLPLDPSPFALP